MRPYTLAPRVRPLELSRASYSKNAPYDRTFAVEVTEPHIGRVPAVEDIVGESLQIISLIETRGHKRSGSQLHVPNGIGRSKLHPATEPCSLPEAAKDSSHVFQMKVDRREILTYGSFTAGRFKEGSKFHIFHL